MSDQEPAPEGCATTLEHERRHTALADWCESEARRLGDIMAADPLAKLGTTITKLIAEAAKNRKLAGEYARRREDASEAARVESIAREMGLGDR